MNKLLALALSLTLALPASAQQATDPGYPTYAAPTFALSQLMPYTPGQANSLRANDVVFFLGDSITWLGTNDTQCQGWVTDFTNQCQTCGILNVSVLSSGISGIGVVGMANTAYMNNVLACHPSIVVIWLGINDVQSGTTYLSWTANSMSWMISYLLAGGVREIVLVSPECRGELAEDYNYWDNDINWLSYYYMTWAQANVIADPAGQCVLTYVPMREEWRLAELVVNPAPRQAAGVLADPTYGLHPTVAGHGFIANVMLKAFGLQQISGLIQAP